MSAEFFFDLQLKGCKLYLQLKAETAARSLDVGIPRGNQLPLGSLGSLCSRRLFGGLGGVASRDLSSGREWASVTARAPGGARQVCG